MAYESKSEQRLARSIDVKGADACVTSSTVERKPMPQDKTKLTGGSIGPKAGKTPLYGSQGVKATSSTLYGTLGANGSSTFGIASNTQNSRGKGGTPAQAMGKHDRSGFPCKDQSTPSPKKSGVQGVHHYPAPKK